MRARSPTPFTWRKVRAKTKNTGGSWQPPRWFAPTIALPGAETLVEAVVGKKAWPAYVLHRYGAGRVLYAAVDETWRWRYEVDDRYHGRFWKQVSESIMERPYTASDETLQLGTDQSVYTPQQPVAIRVRASRHSQSGRDRARCDGHRRARRRRGEYAAARQPTSNDPSRYHGQTETHSLQATTSVRVQIDGIPADKMKAKAQFVVDPLEQAGELAALHLNEDVADRYRRTRQAGATCAKINWGDSRACCRSSIAT